MYTCGGSGPFSGRLFLRDWYLVLPFMFPFLEYKRLQGIIVMSKNLLCKESKFPHIHIQYSWGENPCNKNVQVISLAFYLKSQNGCFLPHLL